MRQAKVLASEQQQEIVAEQFPNLALPHPGYLSTKFSPWHPGVDLATGLGMPVRPIAEGVVEEVNIWLWGYGNHVIVSHSRGLKSLYGHMGRIYVKKGQIVSQNTILGEVGLTGYTSGPHTHLEIQKDGQNIDPLTILPPVPSYPSPETLRPAGGDQIKSDLVKTLKPDFN
ncbi:M23 family metallopeptidase [Candidatus Daviesbacteria bacterium]|nr:M23 family metallopeptidase [Candidatus Daviesbacteria bacterium]